MLELAILGLLREQPLHGYELRKRLANLLGVVATVSYGSLYPALARLEGEGAVAAVAVGQSGPSAAPAELPIPMTGSLTGEWAAWQDRRRARRAGPAAVTASQVDPESPGGPEPSGPPDPTGAAGQPRSRGARHRRIRKVYAITDRGMAHFDNLLVGGELSAEDDRDFTCRLAFARHLAPEARLRLFERRRAVLADRRDRAMQDRAMQDRAMQDRAGGTGAVPDSYRAALADRRAEALDADVSWLDRLLAAERARSTTAAPRSAPSPSGVAGHPGPALQRHPGSGAPPGLGAIRSDQPRSFRSTHRPSLA